MQKDYALALNNGKMFLEIENNCITVHFKNDCLLDVVAVVIRSVMFPELLCFR